MFGLLFCLGLLAATIVLSLIPVYLSTPGLQNIAYSDRERILLACRLIRNDISSASEVLYPSDSGYNETIRHADQSSTMFSTCSVKPDTVVDVAKVLKIIGNMRVPFAIKGGGHSYNPGFSSTTGILIAMTRFREITYNANNQTVNLGAGLLWLDVYEALDAFNVTVVGGRVGNVGIAGLILGGGYGYKSNRYGLSIDNILEYELVTPNGTIVSVNNGSYPDLFFALQGGLNNFGIVTRFTMRALPQGQVYGGTLTYTSSRISQMLEAVSNFQMNYTDPKAAIVGSCNITQALYACLTLFFYDEPTVSNGLFDKFLEIESTGNLSTKSYLSLFRIQTIGNPSLRYRFACISVIRISANVYQTITDRLIYYNSTLGSRSGASFTFVVEPYISTYFDHSQGSAYPHNSSSTPLIPVALRFGWLLAVDDDVFINAMKSTAHAILQAAIDDGQNVSGSNQIVYPNYALPDTPLEHLYGNNVARLQNIRAALDPQNIMSLTGGFKL